MGGEAAGIAMQTEWVCQIFYTALDAVSFMESVC